MSFKTASTILRQPWLIESEAGLRCLELLDQSRQSGKPFTWYDEEEETEPGIYEKLFNNADVVVAPIDKWQAREHSGYVGKAVAILPVLGPLMKEDFCGLYGMASLKSELYKMKAAGVKEVLIVVDSPGGTVDGTEALASTIRTLGLPTTTLVNGYMCSAAYWIGSSSNKVLATNKTDVIGSIGTMISFYDRTKYLEENGIILREYYATESSDKNKDFREARKGNGKLIVQGMLDPINDVFLSAVKLNRSHLNEKETLTGLTFLSTAAEEHGLIDGIASMEEVITETVNKYKNTNIKMKIPNSFKNIFSFLKKEVKEGTTDAELSQEDLAKIDAIIPQYEQLQQEAEELRTAAASNTAALAAAQKEVGELKAEKATAQTTIAGLQEEVKTLGGKDGGTFTSTTAEEEKKTEEATNVMEMPFQKELLAKL